MEVRIDWISFTVPGSEPDPTQTRPEWFIALNAVHKFAPAFVTMFRKEGQIVDGGGRAPFKASLRNTEVGASIFYGHKSNLVLVEITGNGCETLRKHNGLSYIISRCKDRVTRIDLACDWQTEVKPTEFASKRDGSRFKSGGVLHSETGETVYVGSRSSDRYARVYRYNPPHPRAHLLRCEMVFKDVEAKGVCSLLCNETEHAVAKKAGNTFTWCHELWLGDLGSEEKLESWRANDRGGGTLRWLYTQVTPALERLIQEGQKEAVIEFVASIATLCYTD